MLLPDRHLVADLLARYRAWERLVLVDPLDVTTRRRFEDVAYTLCVLMGQRTAREAIWQAEAYLRRIRPVPIFPDGTEPDGTGPNGTGPNGTGSDGSASDRTRPDGRRAGRTRADAARADG
ncbi:DUF5133 domain-containing protein [Streptomyces sp. NPDC127033]|uniref:DUF5133 domain-containing protein n=1 Tax=Streptomyces sp. NPDC127033 TaxID=3347110 RepID=UPI00365133D2